MINQEHFFHFPSNLSSNIKLHFVDPEDLQTLQVISQDITSVVLVWSPNVLIDQVFSNDFTYNVTWGTISDDLQQFKVTRLSKFQETYILYNYVCRIFLDPLDCLDPMQFIMFSGPISVVVYSIS